MEIIRHKLVKVMCFVIGLLLPIIIPLLRPNDKVTINTNTLKQKQLFLNSPSMALMDSIEFYSLLCFCEKKNYDMFIYYWLLKDSSYYDNSTGIKIPMRYTIQHFLTDSSDYFIPNQEILDFSNKINEMLQ